MDESAPPFTGPVEIGMHVEVELISRAGEVDHLAFTIVPDDKADFAAGFLGAGTPLAKTILGQTAGRELPYLVADMRAVRLLAVLPQGRAQTEDVAARREAVTRDAVSTSEFITAMMFASAVDTKWGDYDADSLDPNQWEVKK